MDLSSTHHALPPGFERHRGTWRQRPEVLAQLPHQTGDLGAAVEICWRFVQTTTHGADLWFARAFFEGVAAGKITENLPADKKDQVLASARDYAARIFDHMKDPARIENARQHVCWVEVPAGSFLMGGTKRNNRNSERPPHTVTITQPFWVMDAPVTNTLYECFDPEHKNYRSTFQGTLPTSQQGDVPVYEVSWYEAMMFAAWLGEVIPTFHGARLPLEAEWEYACRAGTTTDYHTGAGQAALEQVGWFGKNSKKHPWPIRQKAPNAWGLYDVHGNVWEWCAEACHPYPSSNPSIDPSKVVPLSDISPSVEPACRGGAWANNADYARAAYRCSFEPNTSYGFLGFRLVYPSNR